MQANNKRNNIRLIIDERAYTYNELVNITGIDRLTLYARYKKEKRGAKLIAPIKENMSHKRKAVEI